MKDWSSKYSSWASNSNRHHWTNNKTKIFSRFKPRAEFNFKHVLLNLESSHRFVVLKWQAATYGMESGTFNMVARQGDLNWSKVNSKNNSGRTGVSVFLSKGRCPPLSQSLGHPHAARVVLSIDSTSNTQIFYNWKKIPHINVCPFSLLKLQLLRVILVCSRFW